MNNTRSLSYAKQLRRQSTDAEQRLWQHLKARRLNGLKFKRQQPIGPYIVDFVCFEYRLVIEADGGQHGDCVDKQRDAWLQSHGFTVVHFWNHHILQQTSVVLEQILNIVEQIDRNTVE